MFINHVLLTSLHVMVYEHDVSVVHLFNKDSKVISIRPFYARRVSAHGQRGRIRRHIDDKQPNDIQNIKQYLENGVSVSPRTTTKPRMRKSNLAPLNAVSRPLIPLN